MPTKKTDNLLVSRHVRMWPREIFDIIGSGKEKKLSEELRQPGVYVLYRDDQPYYVGKADNMRARLGTHATNPTSRLYHFWNFFSTFVIEDPGLRSKVEGILIAAMPTANSANPKLPKQAMPPISSKAATQNTPGESASAHQVLNGLVPQGH